MGFWGVLGRKCNFGGDHPLFSMSQFCAVPRFPYFIPTAHSLQKGLDAWGQGLKQADPGGLYPPPQRMQGVQQRGSPHSGGDPTSSLPGESSPCLCRAKIQKKKHFGDLCILPVWVTWTNLSHRSPKKLVPKPWRATAKQQTCSGMCRVPCRARPTCSHALRRVSINSNRWL